MHSRSDFLGFWGWQTGRLSRCLEPATSAGCIPFSPHRPGYLGVLVVARSPSEVLLCCWMQDCVLWAQPSQVGRGERVCYQGDGAGQASALQIWSARAHSHGQVPPRKGRSEREGQAHAGSTTEPLLPPASVRVCGAAAEVRAGPEARRSRRGVCLGSPHPLMSASAA